MTIVGTLTLSSNTVYLNLSNNVPNGTYTLATYTQSGSSGTFNATPTILSGSFSAGATATVTNGGGVVNLVVTGGAMAPIKMSAPSTAITAKGQFSSTSKTGGRTFTVSYSGVAGTVYVVQRSTDLINWENVMTNTMPAKANTIYTDAALANSAVFYRVLPLQQ